MLISFVLTILLATSDAQTGPEKFARGLALYKAGDMTAAAAAFEGALAAGTSPFASRYNAACAYALAGAKEKALDHLEKLAANGYTGGPVVASDADFISLRDEPRFQAAITRMNGNIVACKDDPRSRQFDFWVGEWTVRNAAGKHVGASTIALTLDQCVVTEHWRPSGGGSEGRSFNTFDPVSKQWRQFYVDNTGGVTHYEGVLVDGAMKLEGEQHSRLTQAVKTRMTYTRQADGSVRQFGEISPDGGMSWTASYDLIYVRAGSAAKGQP